MRPSKQDIPNNAIDQLIYKNFEFFKSEKNIKIADFLNKLDLKLLTQREYRSIKFSYESLTKLILFMKLKGIRFQSQLHTYLKLHKEEKRQLGFKKIPNRRTINYFIHHVLDKETTSLINSIVCRIQKISEKFGFILDTEILTPKKPKKKIKTANAAFKEKKTREVSKFFKKRCLPFINLKLRHNTIYKKHKLVELLLYIGMHSDFAENGSKTHRIHKKHKRIYCPRCKSLMGPKILENGDEAENLLICKNCNKKQRISPDADTVLYHLKKYKDTKEIQNMFRIITEIILKEARKANLFKKKADIAIDFTDWLYYGNINDPMVVGGKKKDGTFYRYRFATVNICEADKRFTLLTIPTGPFDRTEDVLRKLLRHTIQRIPVRKVYVDRGFFSTECIKVIDKEFHLKYIMPCKKNEKVKKKLMTPATPPIVVKDCHMKDIKFNAVIVNNKKGKKTAFATNINYNEHDVDLSKRLFLEYGKRWGIETSYRIKKHTYLPKTTSKNYHIRLFYFLFAVLLYNLWIIADIQVCIYIKGGKTFEHLITSKYFQTLFYFADPG